MIGFVFEKWRERSVEEVCRGAVGSRVEAETGQRPWQRLGKKCQQCGWGWWPWGGGTQHVVFHSAGGDLPSPSFTWPGTQRKGLFSAPLPKGPWGLLRPPGLYAFWFLSGPCFPQPRLFSLAPKEVFFSSEWVWRMKEPSLIWSCSCLLRRAPGGGLLWCAPPACVHCRPQPWGELEDYCSWGSLPPPHPKTNEGKAGTFFFHMVTHFCISDRERIIFNLPFLVITGIQSYWRKLESMRT